MPASQITDGHVVTAALVGAGIWVWRALAVGMRLGELTNEVKNLRKDMEYMRDKLDGHVEKTKGTLK